MDEPVKRPRTTGPTCGYNRKQGRGPCGNPAGMGTDHKGYGHCKLHFGNQINHVRQAVKLMAEDASQKFGVPIESTAAEAMLDSLYHANGAVAFYKARVEELTTDQMTFGHERITRSQRPNPNGPGVMIEDVTIAKTQENVWLRLLNAAETHRLKVSATIATLKIEDRRIKVAEDLGTAFYEALLLTLRNRGMDPLEQAEIIQALPGAVATITGEVLEG